MDDLTEFAINCLLSGAGARSLPLALVQRKPDLPMLELTLIITLSASSIESMFDSPQMLSLACETWRMAALVGIDIHMMQQLGMPAARAADLLRYWQAEDGFFLTRQPD